MPNLQYLHLYGNRFTDPPALPTLPKLHSLWLNSGRLTSLAALDLSNLPSLRKLVLFGNKLRKLSDGELNFHSPKVDLIDLSDNDLSESISPKAIRGIFFKFKFLNTKFCDCNTYRLRFRNHIKHCD